MGDAKGCGKMSMKILWILLGLAAPAFSQDTECSTFDGRRGVCMDFASCLKAQGTPGNAIRIELCAKRPFVCCRKDSRHIAEKMCARWRQVAGRSSCSTFGTRIHGGNFAQIEEYPYMVAVVDRRSNKEAFCGATLISENFAITAAHCIEDLTKRTSQLYIRAGAVNLRTDDSQLIEIINPIQHPEYNPGSSYHDIAILPLGRNVEFSSTVIPACLPTTTSRLAIGTPMTVTGWGATESSQGSENLLFGEVTTISRLRCSNLFSELNFANSYRAGITDSIICVNETQAGACTGDSGGPLTVQVEGRRTCEHVVFGLVARGALGCQSTVIPGLYTNLQFYIDWIVNEVWPEESGFP